MNPQFVYMMYLTDLCK